MQIYYCALLLCFLVCLSKVTPKSTSATAEPSARIVNGYEADISEVPYQAALRRRISIGWSHTCGAVVIAARAVLTAAHCSSSYESSPYDLRITVGTSYRLSGGRSYNVYQVIVHEEYSVSTLIHDISMLVTDKHIEFSQSVQPIAVASADIALPEGTEAIVSGFGTTAFNGSASAILLAAKVKVVSQETCLKAYLRIASVTYEMICASASSPLRDACQGDSGGPLVAGDYLIGLVSWGEGCADPLYPGVYTRVSEYSEWVQTKLETVS